VVPAARRDADGIGGIARIQHSQNDEGPVVNDRPFSFFLTSPVLFTGEVAGRNALLVRVLRVHSKT
jgi:hypothetical protein